MPVVAKTPYALKAALFLPTRTAAALYHGKLAPDLQADPRAAFAAAAQWARAEYAAALESAEHFAPERKAAVAAQLSRFTGLDVSLIDTATLIVKRGQFGQQLLRDQQVTLDRFDDRRTHAAGWEMGRSAADIARDALTVRYLRVELGYRTDLAYLGSEAGYVPVTDTTPSSPDQQWAYDQNAPPQGLRAAAGRGVGAGAPARGRRTAERRRAVAAARDGARRVAPRLRRGGALRFAQQLRVERLSRRRARAGARRAASPRSVTPAAT